MARRRSDMTVSFPSPLKDDPPPPYHSCYIPGEASYPPPYNNTNTTYATLPPPYQSVDPLVASGSGSTETEPHSLPSSTAPTLANSTSGDSSPTTPNPVTPSTDNTQDMQQQETNVEESRSTPEAVGERVPLVVVSTSQNN